MAEIGRICSLTYKWIPWALREKNICVKKHRFG